MSQHWNWLHLATCRSTHVEFLNDNCGVLTIRLYCMTIGHQVALQIDLVLYSYSPMTVSVSYIRSDML